MSEVSSLVNRKAFEGERQFAWDSTSLGAFKKCPRYYQLTILEGWTGRVESPHLRFGILFHRAMEFFDQARVDGEWNDAMLIRTLRAVMREAGSFREDGSFRPWTSMHPTKNLESLVRSTIWYYEQYPTDAFRVARLADGRAAVELSFRYELPLEVDGQTFLYCGHLDALGEYAGEMYFLDRKTTGGYLNPKYYEQFSPHLQMTGYTVAGKVCFSQPVRGGIIDAVQVAGTFSAFGRHILTFADEQLEEWMHNTQFAIASAAKHSSLGWWPMNENACTMYGGCTFQSICSKPASLRERFLRAHFVQKAWDPLTPRGVSE